ncbi:hypothetical protein GGI25_000992 [Coemansia spiralis]|uniref:Protein YOP1 n=2 Tax=Coemansia TaxID=4863 RepID=A0A9W8KYW7_9FUNG|nr:TB2/DP1, HVA22 family-domain-containing protein [Coemansia spiralis]KAJ1986795.1 hypothetical protein EDC05_006145 [Coemansia umbellata]KAJ2621649.1 hypothetical protein GGI26_003985 [Coemansia sp. RSA 1358]KAJ2680103.1 hypothetical protein GGI25_000992 [Coemansia spiralis]
MFGLVTRTICVGVGFLFPAYKCFKLLRGGPEALAPSGSVSDQRDIVKSILKYWIVMAGFTAAEFIADVFLFWLPLVGLVKVTFIAWLVLPGINGAEITYDYILEPYLAQNEEFLDRYFQQARAVAQRSTSTASKTAYDRWVGYMQQAINRHGDGATSQSSSSQGTEGVDGENQAEPMGTGLAGLLKTVSQKMPNASTAASYLAGLSGITEEPPTQADSVGRPAVSSMLTSWLTSFSSNSFTAISDHQRLQDIRSRKQQLHDMVAQLENSERSILAKKSSETTSSLITEATSNNPNDASEFEDDAVMVGDPENLSSSEARKNAESSSGSSGGFGDNDSKKAQSVSSSTSRRWFW